MEYHLFIEFGFFVLLALILGVAFIVPSKKRIVDQGIVYVSPFALKAQYILGGIAMLLCVGLVLFFFIQDDRWLYLFNAGFLGPLGLLLIINSHSTNKLVEQVSAGGDGLVMPYPGDDEEVIVAVAEVQDNAPKVRPSAPAKKNYEVITIQCPGCDKYLKIENRGEGTPITCPGCGLEGEL